MKKIKYLVTIEMPDGDMISPGWIQELIQADCDVENEGRQKVLVEEIKPHQKSIIVDSNFYGLELLASKEE